MEKKENSSQLQNAEIEISLNQVVPRIFGMEFPMPINWTIRRGEQWCVIGPNGSGKTMLADLLAGQYAVKSGKVDYAFWTESYRKTTTKTYPSAMVRKVSFESAYHLSDYKNMYFQQRYSSTENEESPTVQELLSNIPESEYISWLCEKLHLKTLFHKHLIMLSSGELRRLLIVLALADRPRFVVFDNPFIGLDAEMRCQMDDFFVELSAFQQMIFLVPAINEIPKATTKVLKADQLTYEEVGSPAEFVKKYEHWLNPTEKHVVPQFPSSEENVSRPCQFVLRMRDINLSYHNKKGEEHHLFEHLNWEIRRGEKWALLGGNGAGKSTLLSLLAADNPKAYSMDITIFDKKRGTGESVWDIKKPIGYISSEMHLYFQENQSCLKIVGSGLFDTVGLFRECTERQEAQALAWMQLLGIAYLKDRPYLKISGGEQRMVLLARTMVKNPDLLILDEPLHGLDMKHKKMCRAVIEEYCKQDGKTLIYVTHRKEEIPSCVGEIFELKTRRKQ